MSKEWQFLNFSKIEETTNDKTRTAVRSHVTKRQHRLAKRTVALSPTSKATPGQTMFAVKVEEDTEQKPFPPPVSKKSPGLSASDKRGRTRSLAGHGKKLQPLPSRHVVKLEPAQRSITSKSSFSK
jgi:hypothetical protein